MPILRKNITLSTTTLRDRPDEYKTRLIRAMEKECLPGFVSGELKTVVDSVFPLSNASEALERMTQNLNVGKIVLLNDL